MSKKILQYFLFILACFFLMGCEASQTTQKSNLTAGMAKQKIIKGVTSQDELLEVFGAPNIITKNKSGNEVWTYDKVSTDKSFEDGYWNVVINRTSKGQSSTTAKTFTLMIEFDTNDVVKDFNYKSSSF